MDDETLPGGVFRMVLFPSSDCTTIIKQKVPALDTDELPPSGRDVYKLVLNCIGIPSHKDLEMQVCIFARLFKGQVHSY